MKTDSYRIKIVNVKEQNKTRGKNVMHVSLNCFIVRRVLWRCNLVAATRLRGVSLAVRGVYLSFLAPMHPRAKDSVWCMGGGPGLAATDGCAVGLAGGVLGGVYGGVHSSELGLVGSRQLWLVRLLRRWLLRWWWISVELFVWSGCCRSL